MKHKYLFIIIPIIILMLGFIIYFVILDREASELPIISNFFPETEKTQTEKSKTINGEENIITSRDKKEEDLLAISENPISSFISDGQSVYYLDKLNGNLHKTDLNGENEEIISNTTIINVVDVYWGAPGKNAVLKFLDEDEKPVFFSAEFNGSSTEGVFLPKNTLTAASAKNENKIAYLSDEKERGVLFVSDNTNKTIRQLFSFPARDFRVNLKNDGKLFLLSAPSYLYQGFLYALNIKTANNFDKIASGMGLNIMTDEDGKRGFVSISGNKQIENKIILFKENKEYDLSLKSFPEKCVFSVLEKDVVYCAVPKIMPSANYPDDWYSGEVSFNDDFYKIDYIKGENKLLNKDGSSLFRFDAKNLILNGDENYLFFINKNDSRLWRIKKI